MTNGSLMQVKSIAECSPWSILQYFWPALSGNWSENQILVFECGRFRQVLLYYHKVKRLFHKSQFLWYSKKLIHKSKFNSDNKETKVNPQT